MRSTRTLGQTLATVLATVLGAAVALVGPMAGAGTAAGEDPMTGAPGVGDCYDVSYAKANADWIDTAAVPCSGDHTMVTTAVVELPAGTDLSTDDAAWEFAASTCLAAKARLIGGNDLRLIALTLYQGWIFVPTPAQQQAGARWASCHVAVWDTKGLNDLPSKLPRLAKHPKASVARCITRDREQSVTCAERHGYRAVHAAYVKTPRSDKAAEKAVRARAGRLCIAKAGRTSLFSWYRATSHQAVLTCFRKTTR